MALTPTNFFSYYVLHPTSPQLTAKEQRIALVASIVLGVLTLGIYHAVCALVNHTFKWLPPGTTTSSTDVFHKRISTSRSSTPREEAPTLREIENHFWLMITDASDGALARHLQMLLLKESEKSSCNWEVVATSLVDYFEGMYHQRFDEVAKGQLIKQVAQNLHQWPYEPKRIDREGSASANTLIVYDRVLELSDDSYLGVYKTGDDGSCGFHALMGKPTVHGGVRKYMAENIAAVREEFCDHLRERHAGGHLPTQIENVLDDYFDRFAISPSGFQTDKVRAIHRDLSSRYPVIHADDSPEARAEKVRQQEALKVEFRNNKTVFESYLGHLARVETYLLQDELMAVANWKKITIRLAQPGWGEDRHLVTHTLNEGHDRVVDIYYNGYNHYEHAELIADVH